MVVLCHLTCLSRAHDRIHSVMLVRDSFESVWWSRGLFGGCNWFRYANVDDAIVLFLCLVWKEINGKK